VREFFQIAREREGTRLTEWGQQVASSAFSELKRFCRGLRRDWDAVVAGLTLEWSNGPTEGHVNRLKLVKRQMYGRAGFELLRARVLPLTTPG
jgi:transposase